MSTAQSLRRDAEELQRLAELTESLNVKYILTNEADKLRQLADVEEKSAASSGVEQKAASRVIKNANIISKIVNYAWDQSDKFLKIYVTLSGVQKYPTEDILIEFSVKSFELQVLGPDKKNHVLTIKNLLHEIVPSESYHKIKTDMVVIYLKKASSQHWSYVTESEKKAKEPKTPKFDKEEDPGASLMNLMKQMYDDGDDEMKRTIAKAWTEARDKKSPEEML